MRARFIPISLLLTGATVACTSSDNSSNPPSTTAMPISSVVVSLGLSGEARASSSTDAPVIDASTTIDEGALRARVAILSACAALGDADTAAARAFVNEVLAEYPRDSAALQLSSALSAGAGASAASVPPCVAPGW